MTEPYTLKVAEASERTGLGRTKLYELIKSGQVEARYIGPRNLVIVWSSLKEWIKKRPTGPAEP